MEALKEKKILIVDDEEDILELIRYNLEKEGYSIICAASGEDAMKVASGTIPDLIVLDLMLPGISGIEVAERLKKSAALQHIPIIMLTAKGEEADIVKGLEMGADDYITKPFSPKILLARVQAVLRRLNETNGDSRDMMRIHELSIHPGKRYVSIHGKTVDLTFTEFQVLFYLSQRPGWVSTRSQIVDAVRGEGYPVTDRSVDVQIVGLRKKLGPYGKYIQTVRGVGYKFAEKA